MKIVLNTCFGGFSVSAFGVQKVMERKNIPVFFYDQTKFDFRDKCNEYTKLSAEDLGKEFFHSTSKDYGEKAEDIYDEDHYIYMDEIYRTDKDLIAVLEEYGTDKVSGMCGHLEVEEIPDGVLYKINEYDGLESIEYRNSDDWCVSG